MLDFAYLICWYWANLDDQCFHRPLHLFDRSGIRTKSNLCNFSLHSHSGVLQRQYSHRSHKMYSKLWSCRTKEFPMLDDVHLIFKWRNILYSYAQLQCKIKKCMWSIESWNEIKCTFIHTYKEVWYSQIEEEVIALISEALVHDESENNQRVPDHHHDHQGSH